MIFFLLLIDIFWYLQNRIFQHLLELLRIGDSKENPNYLGKNQNTKILLLKSAKNEKKRASSIIKKLFELSLAHYEKY